MRSLLWSSGFTGLLVIIAISSMFAGSVDARPLGVGDLKSCINAGVPCAEPLPLAFGRPFLLVWPGNYLTNTVSVNMYQGDVLLNPQSNPCETRNVRTGSSQPLQQWNFPVSEIQKSGATTSWVELTINSTGARSGLLSSDFVFFQIRSDNGNCQISPDQMSILVPPLQVVAPTSAPVAVPPKSPPASPNEPSQGVEDGKEGTSSSTIIIASVLSALVVLLGAVFFVARRRIRRYPKGNTSLQPDLPQTSTEIKKQDSAMAILIHNETQMAPKTSTESSSIDMGRMVAPPPKALQESETRQMYESLPRSALSRQSVLSRASSPDLKNPFLDPPNSESHGPVILSSSAGTTLSRPAIVQADQKSVNRLQLDDAKLIADTFRKELNQWDDEGSDDNNSVERSNSQTSNSSQLPSAGSSDVNAPIILE